MITVVDSLVPRVYLESSRRAGQMRMAWKFILIETMEALHLVAGPVTEYPYHANLVSQFCDQNEIPASWEKKPHLVRIFDPGVRIRGGGHIRIDLKLNRMKLYGRSTAYGSFDLTDVRAAVSSDSFFDGFEVFIQGT